MSAITSQGSVFYQARITSDELMVLVNNTPSKPAPAKLMPDIRIAASPTGQVAIAARSAAAVGYGCIFGGPWFVIGPTNQPQDVAWIDGRFVWAQIGPGGASLNQFVLESGTFRLIDTKPANTSQGILYYDEGLRLFLNAHQKPFTIGPHTGYRAVRRKMGDEWIYIMQKVAVPGVHNDALFVTNGADVNFLAGRQREVPQLAIIGTSIYVNDGLKFPPPYKGVNVPWTPPTPPPPPPEPPEEPPVAIPDNKAVVVAARVRYAGLPPSPRRGFLITNAAAWALRAAGAGILAKPSGTNFNGYSIDNILYKPGRESFDVLGDAEGAATPQWNRTSPTGFGDLTNWRAPIDPASFEEPGPEPPPPPPPPPPSSDIEARLTAIEQILLAVVGNMTSLANSVAANTTAVITLKEKIDAGLPATLSGKLIGINSTLTGKVG